MTYLPKHAKAYVRDELNLRQKRRPHYSMRAMARDLEMSPSSLCEFLSGRQGMSRERALWVGTKIGLADIQIEHFCDLIESEFGRSNKERKLAQLRISTRVNDDENRISVDEFHFIADWYHLTLLEILDLPDCDYSDGELAGILNIEVDEVKKALKRLQQLEMIKLVNNKYLVQNDVTVTGGEGPNRAIQLYHEQFLRMHTEMVPKKSVLSRENVSVSLSIAEEDWEPIREELKDCVLKVLSKYATNSKNKNQVVCFTMQALTLLEDMKHKLLVKHND